MRLSVAALGLVGVAKPSEAQAQPDPILFVHGDRDRLTKTEWAAELFDRARGPKELWIMEGTGRPEYGKVVDIVTRDSLRELATPGILAILAPVAVGYAGMFLMS